MKGKKQTTKGATLAFEARIQPVIYWLLRKTRAFGNQLKQAARGHTATELPPASFG